MAGASVVAPASALAAPRNRRRVMVVVSMGVLLGAFGVSGEPRLSVRPGILARRHGSDHRGACAEADSTWTATPFPGNILIRQEELVMRLNGKIGIVTAAASGMGRAGALRFAREGAQVAV